jgi:hypothetical protein
MKLVALGKYKVAYWRHGNALHSVMFDRLEDGKEFLARKQQDGFLAILMHNTRRGEGSYSWEVLDGGLGNSFNFFTAIYRYRLWVLGGAIYWFFIK